MNKSYRKSLFTAQPIETWKKLTRLNPAGDDILIPTNNSSIHGVTNQFMKKIKLLLKNIFFADLGNRFSKKRYLIIRKLWNMLGDEWF